MPLVYLSALFAVLQLGSACATGAALEPVGLASTVFAAIGASEPAVTVPHVGALDGPFDTMAWPAVEPAGFSSCTGASVAASAAKEDSASSAEVRSRFI